MTEAKYLVFDTETTGVDVFNDRIVQLVIATADADGNLLEEWEWIIDPGVEVPEEAANVHGFTTEYLRQNGTAPGRALNEALDVFAENTDLVWVAYNLSFDFSLLAREYERHLGTNFGQYEFEAEWFDPLIVDRAKDKYRKGKRKLENVAAAYGVPFNPSEAHKAGYDVAITAKVAARVAERYGIPTVAEQAQMHVDWAEGFETWLREAKGDNTIEIERDWPLKKEG